MGGRGKEPNSVLGLYEAKSKFRAFKILQSLIPDMIHDRYNRDKFKLICDDLGLANLIVRNQDDLTIVGVIDLEWSYIGPAQLFSSAPWWLLQDRPVNSAWYCTGGEPPPQIGARYFKYLKILTRVLEEEESVMPGCEGGELSSLVKWSQDTGAMWLHMILSSGFNDHRSFPFVHLRRHIGAAEWGRRERELCCQDEAEEFAVRKVKDLEDYDEDLDKLEEEKARVDRGEVTQEEFVATALLSPV